MTPLIQALRAAVELSTKQAVATYWADSDNQFQDKGAGCFANGAQAENARLKPILLKLIAVAEAAEDANAQIKDQRTMWPAEVDSLDDRLADLRASLGVQHE